MIYFFAENEFIPNYDIDNLMEQVVQQISNYLDTNQYFDEQYNYVNESFSIPSKLKNLVNKETDLSADEKSTVKQGIESYVDNFVKKFSIPYNAQKTEKIKKQLADSPKQKILLAAKYLACAIIINSTVAAISPIVATTICAPMVEEYCKKASIENGCDKEFFIIFNTYEFTHYVVQWGGLVGPIIIPVRLLTVGMHGVTTLIQKAFHDEKVIEKLKLKDKPGVAHNIGYTIGVVFHAAWNSGLGNAILRMLHII